MTSKLTPEEIQRIRDVRIHRILGINDNGRDMKVRCVFHQEKTPSLLIRPDNSFHCFGCGTKGIGAIDFCVGLGYTFIQALEELTKYI